MKPSKAGAVAAAILVSVAVMGFGMAHAEGTDPQMEEGLISSYDYQTPTVLETSDIPCPYTENNPVLSFEDQEALERGGPPDAFTENRPVLSFEDQETLEAAMMDRESRLCASR
jgi:hypothetical protein